MKIPYSLLYRIVKSSLRIPSLQKLMSTAHMMPQINNPKPIHVTGWNKEKMKLSSVYVFKVYMKQVLCLDSRHIPDIPYYLYANIPIVKTVHHMLTLLWTLSLYNQGNIQYDQTKLLWRFLTVGIHKMFAQCVLIFLIYIVLAQIFLNKLPSTSHKALFFLTVFSLLLKCDLNRESLSIAFSRKLYFMSICSGKCCLGGDSSCSLLFYSECCVYWQLLSPTELAFSFFILMRKEWFALSPGKSHFLLWLWVLALCFREPWIPWCFLGYQSLKALRFHDFVLHLEGHQQKWVGPWHECWDRSLNFTLSLCVYFQVVQLWSYVYHV